MRYAATAVIFASLLFSSGSSEAHWCSNIWQAPARLVVKPESSTITIASSGTTRFRVYMGNNFPYKLNNVRLRGTASGYAVNVTPSNIAMGPGQVIGFEFAVTPSGGATGNVDVASLGIEVAFDATGGTFPDSYHNKPYDPQLNRRCAFSSEFGGAPTDWVRTNTTEAASVALYEGGACWAYQSTGLAVAAVAEAAPNQPMPNGRNPVHTFTAMEQLIHMFGYRNCYSYDGRQWACFASQNCGPFGPQTNVCTPPEWSSNDNRFGQSCIRAGAQLAMLHSRGLLGSYLGAARNAAINAMTGSGGCGSDPDNERCNDAYKCMGAVIGALLWRGASNTGPFTTALASGANAVPGGCRTAATHILQGNQTLDCSSYSTFYEEAACATAAGLRGDQGPVSSILWQRALHYNFSRLYYGYMMSIVAQDHRAAGQTITYYPDAGAPLMTDALPPDMPRPPDQSIPPPDTTVDTFTPPADTSTPPADTSTPPADTSTTPTDTSTTPTDTSTTPTDSRPVDQAIIITEGGVVVPVDQGAPPPDRGLRRDGATGTLTGGCSVASESTTTPGVLALLLSLFVFTLGRRRRR